jgi:transcriptional regulator with XRE-family HTH domain
MLSARDEARIRESFAANVKRLRERRGLTQLELSERVDCELRFMQRIETGRVNPSLTTVVAFARALDVRPGLLFRIAKLPVRRSGRPRRRRPGKSPAQSSTTRRVRRTRS